MDLEKLQETVDQMRVMQQFGRNDSILVRYLLEFVYNEYGGNLTQIFLSINEMEKETQKKQNQILYGGLEDAMHLVANYSGVADKPKVIKILDRLVFNSDVGNISFIIRIAMAYFPTGTSERSSLAGKEFFTKFKDLLLKHKDKYLTGDSKNWADTYGYSDYIRLVIEKNS